MLELEAGNYFLCSEKELIQCIVYSKIKWGHTYLVSKKQLIRAQTEIMTMHVALDNQFTNTELALLAPNVMVLSHMHFTKCIRTEQCE